MIIKIKDGKEARADAQCAEGQVFPRQAAEMAAAELRAVQAGAVEASAGVPPAEASADVLTRPGADQAIPAGASDVPSIGVVADPYGKENYARMKRLLKERVSPRRFKHSKGVAKTARMLARVYGYPDPAKARMAGLVHDWDKRYVGPAASERADELGVDAPDEVKRSMPWLLHGPTGAEALRREFPELGEDVFQAVARHTSGSVDMTDLDMIVFVADLIEPNRTFQDVDEVRQAVGKDSLEELFFRSFRTIFTFLVEHERLLHPDMVEIWNHYAARRPGVHKGRLSSHPDPKLEN